MDNFFSLYDGEENKPYHIVSITCSDKVKRRLLELGFVNCIVKIIKKSHSSGVFLLELRGFVLALKSNEVKSIMVKK